MRVPWWSTSGKNVVSVGGTPVPASQIVAGKYLIIGRPPPRVEIRRRLWFTSRLEALHAAKLFLADEELYAVWDAIADSEEAAEDDRVPRLISLSGKMASDRAFARQLQRKKWL